MAVLGNVLLGTCAWGVLSSGGPAVVADGVCSGDVGTGSADARGALEAAPPVVPPAVAGEPMSVLTVSSVVMSVDVRLATEVPLVKVTGEVVIVVTFSSVLLSPVSTDLSFLTTLFHIMLGVR